MKICNTNIFRFTVSHKQVRTTPLGNLYPFRKFIPLQENYSPLTDISNPSWKFVHQHEKFVPQNLYPKICTPKFVPLLKNLYTKMKYHGYPEY